MSNYVIVSTKWTCPECRVTFTDPDEYVYGHDCES